MRSTTSFALVTAVAIALGLSITSCSSSAKGRYFGKTVAPKDNVFGGVPGQSYNTAADGFYLIVAPLPPGQHTIRFGGVSRNFATDTTYNLTVE